MSEKFCVSVPNFTMLVRRYDTENERWKNTNFRLMHMPRKQCFKLFEIVYDHQHRMTERVITEFKECTIEEAIDATCATLRLKTEVNRA